MKLCAIGRFRGLAHAYLPHRHTDRMLSCACLAKVLFLFRRKQKECSNSFIIIMLDNCFGTMLECGGPSDTNSLPRKDCSDPFGPVAASFWADGPFFLPRQDSIAYERPVVTKQRQTTTGKAGLLGKPNPSTRTFVIPCLSVEGHTGSGGVFLRRRLLTVRDGSASGR